MKNTLWYFVDPGLLTWIATRYANLQIFYISQGAVVIFIYSFVGFGKRIIGIFYVLRVQMPWLLLSRSGQSRAITDVKETVRTCVSSILYSGLGLPSRWMEKQQPRTVGYSVAPPVHGTELTLTSDAGTIVGASSSRFFRLPSLNTEDVRR